MQEERRKILWIGINTNEKLDLLKPNSLKIEQKYVFKCHCLKEAVLQSLQSLIKLDKKDKCLYDGFFRKITDANFTRHLGLMCDALQELTE